MSQEVTDSRNSPDDLLKMALDGRETDWERLHELCQYRGTAEALARLLEGIAPPVSDEARAWAESLQEMHPGLKVRLADSG